MDNEKLNIKDWMLRVRGIDGAINAELDELETIQSNVHRLVASFSLTKTHTIHADNAQEELYADYIDRKQRIVEEIRQKRKIVNEVKTVLNQIENNRYYEILMRYYINGEAWRDIADKMNLSEQWVKGKLHGRALLVAEKIRDRLGL